MNTQSATGKTGSRLASMIGLCRRANRLGCGVDTIKDALKTGRAHVVLLASDPSERTRKQLCDKCRTAGVELIPVSLPKEELGRACGLMELSACAVLDAEFAKAIRALAGCP